MRPFRMGALGALLLALILSACSTGEGDQSPSTTDGATSATLASTLRFGGPPECPERPFCLIGLEETYGLEFAEFVPLDVGGPIRSRLSPTAMWRSGCCSVQPLDPGQ